MESSPFGRVYWGVHSVFGMGGDGGGVASERTRGVSFPNYIILSFCLLLLVDVQHARHLVSFKRERVVGGKAGAFKCWNQLVLFASPPRAVLVGDDVVPCSIDQSISREAQSTVRYYGIWFVDSLFYSEPHKYLCTSGRLDSSATTKKQHG